MNSTTAVPRMTHLRWTVCALLFFATVIAYVDRGVLAYLNPELQGIFKWDSRQYSYMTTAFTAAYAIGLVCAGRLTDRLGTRLGFALAIVLWSFSAMSPGAATSVLTFAIAMFFLGLGEAANFPACIKTVAEWFPKKERALATGIFNSGANVGAIVVPIIVVFLKERVGWRGTFVVTGASGFIWLLFWLWLYHRPEEHPRLSGSELAHIQSDREDASAASVPWLRIIPCKETWAFALAKALTDPIWWFYLFWLPAYLQSTFHLDIHTNRLPVVVCYGISTIGSVSGGWLSGFAMTGGRSLNAARKGTMLLCALLVLPVIIAPYMHNLWLVVGLIGLAMAAHQGWSANVFTLASDMFPKSAVASVTGFGGMVGAAAGVLFQLSVGQVVHWTHSYVPLFIVAGLAYLVALGIVQALSPTLTPAKLD
ncbi:MAG: MFS transporter [Bryobacteraceae bacterium]|jgi:ACS family hexuronate transporter-like MFS transporter